MYWWRCVCTERIYADGIDNLTRLPADDVKKAWIAEHNKERGHTVEYMGEVA